MDILSLTKEARIYNGSKTISLTSGAGTTGQPLGKEIVFDPLYSLASFVEDKVSIGKWIYLWAFYFVPLIYISVFVLVPYCLDDCGFVVEPEVRQLIPPVPLFFLKIALAIQGFLVFPYKLWNYLF